MTSENSNKVCKLARWIHRWAVLTVCLGVVALVSGALVTTLKVGMADPVWPTYPWHLALIDWKEPKPGFIIEHLHRLADYTLGLCIMALAAGLWLKTPHRRLRWYGIALLAGVIVQGGLGGVRVLLNAPAGPELSMAHGIFAQIVFALLLALAHLTTLEWSPACMPEDEATQRLQRWSTVTLAVTFVQIVFGGLVRHMPGALGQRGHLFFAFGVVASVVWLGKLVFDIPQPRRRLMRFTLFLGGLVAFQILLGIEAWLGKFHSGVLPDLQEVSKGQGFVRVLHFLTGALVFSSASVIALLARQREVLAELPASAPKPCLEGVA